MESIRKNRWNAKYQEVWDFIEQNHRSPSRHHVEEHLMRNWMKYNRRILKQKKMTPEMEQKFLLLLELAKSNRKVNQYM